MNVRRPNVRGSFEGFKTLSFCTISFLFFLLFSHPDLKAQKTYLGYKVVHNGNKIGWIELAKTDSANMSTIVLSSEIKRRVIFLLSVVEKQEVRFSDGQMTSSSIYRKVNDDIKMNRKTVFKGDYYEVREENSSSKLPVKRIHYNLLSMYYREPAGIKQVYSDTFQRFLDIEPKGNGSYKIQLPDGNYNYYYYVNGVCSRIVIEHSLFSIEFVRVK